MDDDDFRALIEILTQKLESVGAADIADKRHYLNPETAEGAPRLHDPQTHLIEMLKAFGRKLATEDSETYRISLSRINENLSEGTVREAVVEVPSDTDSEPHTIYLEESPNLKEIRELNNSIIESIIINNEPKPMRTM